MLLRLPRVMLVRLNSKTNQVEPPSLYVNQDRERETSTAETGINICTMRKLHPLTYKGCEFAFRFRRVQKPANPMTQNRTISSMVAQRRQPRKQFPSSKERTPIKDSTIIAKSKTITDKDEISNNKVRTHNNKARTFAIETRFPQLQKEGERSVESIF